MSELKNEFSILEKIAKNEGKISKTKIKEIKIEIILNNLDLNKLTLKQASLIILGIAKVVSKRIQFLLHECKSYLKNLKNDGLENKKALIPLSTKPATLELKNNILLIEDDYLADDHLLLPNEESQYPNDMSIDFDNNPGFELDFGNNLVAEEARDGTALDSALFTQPDIVNLTIKRRKITEDERTEIDEVIYKGDLKSTIGLICNKTNSFSNIAKNSSLKIDKQILNYFEKCMANEVNIEGQRNASTLLENNTDFDFQPMDHDFQNDVDFNSIEDDKDFDAGVFPEKFNFNLFCSSMTTSDKSKAFYNLLYLSSRGEMKPVQSASFSEIECIKHIN